MMSSLSCRLKVRLKNVAEMGNCQNNAVGDHSYV